MPPPSWLQSATQKSALSLTLHTLDYREQQRQLARLGQDSFLTSTSSSASTSTSAESTSGIPAYIRAHYSCAAGQLPAHRHKNRYISLEPYDRTRVKVPSRPDGFPGNGDTDDADDERYINANWVRELFGGKYWIAAQAPLPNTFHAFLTLCMTRASPHRQRVHTIVQLTMPVENGRRRAHNYFSSQAENFIVHPEQGCDPSLHSIHIHVESEEDLPDARCILTDLRLRWYDQQQQQPVGQEFQATHLLYTGWPDFGVPSDNESILNFVRLVERVNNRHLNATIPSDPNISPPPLVHCSAGVGRTGSFIALSSVLRAYSLLTSHRSASNPSFPPPLPLSPFGPLPSKFKNDIVAHEIDALREQRQRMVERDEQAAWVYQALFDAFNGL